MKPDSYYAKNREKILKQQAEYNAAHKAERAAYSHAHYEKNKEVRRRQMADYHAAHPEVNKAAVQRWWIRNREKQRAYTAEWRKKHPLQYRANVAVSKAVKRGDLVRPNLCSQCGKRCKPQAHHHKGYAEEFWLDVIWLCRPCHVLADG
jgi:hypothetical protein